MPNYHCHKCQLDASDHSTSAVFTHDQHITDGRSDVTTITARCGRCGGALDTIIIRARFDAVGQWVIFVDDFDINDDIHVFEYPDSEVTINGQSRK